MAVIPDEARELARRAYAVGLIDLRELERVNELASCGPVSILDCPSQAAIREAEQWVADHTPREPAPRRSRWWRR